MLRFHLQYYCPHNHQSRLHKLLISSSEFMAMAMASSNNLLKPKPLSISSFAFQPKELFHTRRLLFSNNNNNPSKPSTSNFRPFSLSNSGFSSAARPSTPPPVSLKGSTLISSRLRVLTKKLKELSFEDYEYMPGQYHYLSCPMCTGGESGKNSLALHISEDGNTAAWLCFRGECGWQGNTMAFAYAQSSYEKPNTIIKAKKRELTEKNLELEPLCDEVLAYFAERMISAQTLRRNQVMQKTCGGQILIAFTYRRDGTVVSCKYRDMAKRFWQEADTERIFYGLDDIKNASDIIIVEGEIDKLALEEAGFCNCVSVPHGAPSKVSHKPVPDPEKDKTYQFLWNCKDYFEKASRIILATDGDPPGQALAEELARRLGKERCWRVKWPKKNDVDFFKDANEVLMYLGPGLLKQTIENAELYPIPGLFNFRDYFHEIDAYYHGVSGGELGVSNGRKCLDEYYNALADAPSSYGKLNQTIIKAKKRELTEKNLQLQPLCDELLAYFGERMISAQTLRRNRVMKKTSRGRIAVAFPYWRDGALVSCKYRDVKRKRFWQESDTERIFYGLDDIKNASDIIIVEGEIDKLAMEEAGFCNCVSVPSGAPRKISNKDVPAPDKDIMYQYLWNCKDYFEKASRIILATDGDPPGQALAEELARRLGRERCWRVKWPKKNDVDFFNDANEVLMYLGSGLLKQIIENAELYPIQAFRGQAATSDPPHST